MRATFALRAKDHLDTGDGKVLFNREHFAESANRYDFATRMLSFGQDSRWKRQLIKSLPNVENPVCVDVACGTGDVTFFLGERYPGCECVGIDLTQEMLDIARRKNSNPWVRFLCGEMSSLPLQENSVDVLTGSYAIRNAPSLSLALSEMKRVLKPGGSCALLDFSKSDSRLQQKIQYGLLKFWGSIWGFLLHGNPEVHGYISSSLKQFPAEKELHKLFREAGFEITESRKLFGGMMALHFLEVPDRK